MNYSLLIVFLIATAAFAIPDEQTCWSYFSATDGSFYEVNAGWLTGADQDGNNWFFRICDFDEQVNSDGDVTIYSVSGGEFDPCGILDTDTEAATVCQQTKAGLILKGTDDTVRYSDSPNGEDQGYEIMYGVETATPAIKTLIQLNCDYNQDGVVNITNIDDTFTIISYTGYQCCPQARVGTDSFEPTQVSTNFAPIALFYIMILCSAFFFICCCCTCLVRRRRSQQQKAIAMKQFSSVAFQPIPQSNNAIKSTATVAPQQLPTYNPYLNNQQPQFVYYYPSAQNGSAPQFPFVHPQFQQQQQPQVKQENSDEKIARELQAQFDREM
jgi:hypothetical protein